MRQLAADIATRLPESCITSMTADPSRIQPYPDARSTLESKLDRISEFFADVLLRFVLQDLSVLLVSRLRVSSARLTKWTPRLV
jgi:hypothetical protein